MSRRLFSRFLPALVIAVSTIAMLGVSHDADAKRLGGGGSMGRQSSNITQRQATPPARNPQQSQQAAPSRAPAAAGAAAARSGMSRWLGPIAGIAAGLGLAALLSHLGLGAAAAEFLGSLLLIGLVIFAVLFIVRRLRGGARQPALQGAGNNAFRQRDDTPAPMAREALSPVPAAPAPAAAAAAAPAVESERATGEWGIPSDFDTVNFLSHAKNYFVQLQGVWDRGDVNELRDLVTDDLLAELSQQIGQREGQNVTEVVLLNAELLGIETVSDGHLASVRFSGMLREAPGTEAFRFEEVWNLFKPNDGGWLLAGVQQIPVQEHNR